MFDVDRMFYALFDAKAKLFLDRSVSQRMEIWHRDPEWVPRWCGNPKSLVTHHGRPEAAEKQWRFYEFQRTEYRNDLPRLTIRKLVPRLNVEDAGWVRASLDPVFVMIKRMQVKHGGVMAAALTKIAPEAQPIYAIKRKGKTQQLAKTVLPDTILHEGMFMFFYDDHDIVLAKIALGGNIAYEYDLTPFHA